jgi:hypothetical protein
MASHQIAQGIAQLGRNGDSTLVHMQPHEVAGLQALAKSQGTSLTINPETGLPEAFSLGGFFRSILPTIAGYGAAAAFPQYALMAGIAAGAATGAATNRRDPLMGAVMGGLGGYGGQSLQTSLAGMGAAKTAAANAANPTGAANATMLEAMKADPNFVGKGLGNVDEFIQTGAGSAGVNPAIRENLLKSGLNADDAIILDAANQIKQSATPVTNTTPFMENISASNQGIKDLVTGQPGSWDAFKQSLAGAGNAPVSNLSAATTVGMPVAGAFLGGIEPSDLYGNPIRPGQNPNDKYDPDRALNLNTYTGLKFEPYLNAAQGGAIEAYAQGGPISFAEGGAMQGGGAGAMRGGNLNFNTPSGLAIIQPQGGGAVRDVSNLPPMVRALSGGPAVTPSTPRMALGAMGGGSENRESSLPPMARLSLYAAGGPVSFADGGMADPRDLPGGGLGSLQGGDSAAMQGSAMLPIDVSDINAKYGYDPEASSSGAQPWGGSGLWGSYNTWGARSSMPSVPVPQLGLFADNKQIEEARTAYEAQLAAAMSGRGGMGSTPNAPQVARSMSSLMGGQPTTTTRKGMTLGLGSMGSTAPTADTASTAETSLARLNLNKQYADGGNVEMDSPIPPQLSRDGYGLGRLQAMADGGIAGYAKGGYLDGPGDGMSDSIPATIEGKQQARLADGEFVIPADVVSHLGNGSTKAGSKRLYAMLDRVRKARTGTKKQGKQINPNKFLPA